MVQHPDSGDKQIAKPMAISVYPSDIEAIERLRKFWHFDSASQVVRRAIRASANEAIEQDVLETSAA